MVYLLGPRHWLPFHQNPFQPVVYQEDMGPLIPSPTHDCSLTVAVFCRPCAGSCNYCTVCAVLYAVAMLWSWRPHFTVLSPSFGTLFPFLMLLSLEGYAFRHCLFWAPWGQCRWMDSHKEAEVSVLNFWSSCVYLSPQSVRITSVHHHTWFMSCWVSNLGPFCMLGKHSTNWTTFQAIFNFVRTMF